MREGENDPMRIAFKLLPLAIPFLLAAPVVAGGIDPDVLAVREAAWQAWFAGDEAALRAMLPSDFLALGTSGEEVNDLEKTIVSSRDFKKSGGKLISLTFPETHAQTFGDVVIFYGTFDAKIESAGKESPFKGRLTEVFVKRDGKWYHPGWHLDTAVQ